MKEAHGLTEVQQAYNVAQNELYQLAAFGHCKYTNGELLTDEGRRMQRDYGDRIQTARTELEAATLRLVAEHAQKTNSPFVSVDWLRSLASDPAELSLLALTSEEREEIAGEQAAAPSVPSDADLRDRIAQVVRTIPIRLGPNALAMVQRGEPIILNMSEADAFAEALAPVLPESRREFDAEAGLQRLADDLQRGEAVDDSPAPGEVYRHYKGGLYTVLAVAEDTGTGAPVVVYHDEQQHHWTRPLVEFAGTVADGVQRFILEGELAALPAPADWAGDGIDWKAKYGAEHARHVAVVRQLVADPAAGLRGAADDIDRETQRLKDDGVLEPGQFRPCRDVTADLRRMADEAQQAECACDPAPYRHLDGTYSHLAGCPVADAEQLLDERVAAAKEQPVEARQACPCGQPGCEYCDVEDDDAEEAGDVVAYRNSDRPGVLLCREHGDGWVGLTPLTSDDLPDGGLCDACGVDVLIPQQQAGEGR